ncbi:putative DNA alkylation repair enzyme [Caulobacter sp. AP07]|uniref:DNA alkylation repair protein n=1 Tax=Caulobacter sp. AP07 TaxID=1144304 RepID=UPI00027220A5|nr:DNA alkylation repair protein [Caulobacter sp. AP07]EJL27065.1 putative DNA alkylation repair enzyme [Caulobacter sp. AP07]
MAALRAAATDHDLANLARFGIDAPSGLGVSMANLQTIAKRLGRDHDLAAALWATGQYEARMLASLIDDPAQVTPGQMDAWRAGFDNWAIVDTVCFKLFDQSPHAFAKVGEWAALNDAFGRRAAFALLACLALHGAKNPNGGDNDQPFLDGLVLIERAAGDDRNFVKKSLSWALRAIGGKKSPTLKAAALETARRLAASPDAAPRWVGKDALRALNKPAKGGSRKD